MIDLMVGLFTCLKGIIISFYLSTLVISKSKKQISLRQIYNNSFPYNQGFEDTTKKLIQQQNKQCHQFLLLRTDVDLTHTSKREFAWLKNIHSSFFDYLRWSANQLNLKLFQSFNQDQIQVSEFSPSLEGDLCMEYNKRKAGFSLGYANLEWLLNQDGGLLLNVAFRLSQLSSMRVLPLGVPWQFLKNDKSRQHMLFNNESYCGNIRWQIIVDSAGQVVDVGNASEMVVSWRGNKLNVAYKQELNRNFSQKNAVPKNYSAKSKEISLNSREQYLDVLVALKECLVSFDGSTELCQKILRILGQASNATRVCIYDYSKYGCKFKEKHCTGLIASPKAEWQKKGIFIHDKQVWKNLWSEVFCSHWEQILSRGESISGIVSHLSGAVCDHNMVVTKLAASEHQCQILELQNILSILILPIIAKGEFLGFIRFENHACARIWDQSEITFLQAAVGAISLAYQTCRAEDALQTAIVETGNTKCELESQMHNSTVKLQQEIASRKQVQIELEKSRSLQQATLESTADGILVIDNRGNITGYNQKFVQMWGISESTIKLASNQALKVALSQLKYPKQYIASIRQLLLCPEAQINDAIALKDGRIFERFSQPQSIGGNIVGRVWSFRDITAHKLAEAKIKHQALHDLLTDLPNRVLFNERLADALVQVSTSNEQLAVCFLDLDRFKTINETLGHAIGDQLLQSVSARLTQSLREGDIIARWGGDEFTILLPKIRDVKDAANIQERILAALKPVFDIENHHLHISASIGVALYPVHGEDAETLIKHADVALYGAKSQGRNKYQFYNSAINSQATELLVLENSLYHALERHEFTVHYQPQVNITTCEITKMEALLRWQHPQLGLISPAKFIPLAEDTGLIVPIGEWVLRTACSQTKYWQNKLALPSLSIAVNLSARQFQQPNLVELIKQILIETQLAPECLEVEITESVTMQNIDLTIDILNQLNLMGVSISIDDFGTGYCSLSYLKNFPIHTLKIDRSFVRDLTTNTQNAAITTAIIALAHGLNLAVVAEGVETEEQRDVLQILKCELMQGHLFSRAVSAEDATQLLQKCKFSIIDDSCLIA
jgi:diguanylate cyclase (GGDEF)-like protein/PAS domain S-box-containing protein